MTIKVTWLHAILPCLALLVCSCVSVGKKFELPDATRLRIGELTPTEAHATFGNPAGIEKKMTSNGNFEMYGYAYGNMGFSKANVRLMTLEFKNGKLNGYSLGSTFEKDKTLADLSKAAEIKAGIGRLTKEDVIRIAGQPNGRYLCPTLWEDYKGKCEAGMELMS
jgi:hypothetical protein